MAKCERREIKPEPPPVEYVLTLTEDEAEYLAALVFRGVAGDGYAGEINDALSEAGIRTDRYRFVAQSDETRREVVLGVKR